MKKLFENIEKKIFYTGIFGINCTDTYDLFVSRSGKRSDFDFIFILYP